MNDYDILELLPVKTLKVGCTYFISSHDSVSPMHENGGIYPWGDRNTKVPIKVISENERFWTATVLPHTPSLGGFGKSQPYDVTIDKWNFYHGEFKAWA